MRFGPVRCVHTHTHTQSPTDGRDRTILSMQISVFVQDGIDAWLFRILGCSGQWSNTKYGSPDTEYNLPPQTLAHTSLRSTHIHTYIFDLSVFECICDDNIVLFFQFDVKTKRFHDKVK